MKFSEVVAQTLAWLQRDGRVSYRALKREFDLNDEFLEDLKAEIIDAKRLAVDENGKVLVWTGGTTVVSSQFLVVSPQPPIPNTHSPAERRQLTVMFCDLVGSTALSAQLDPEELREVVRAYQQTCGEIITRYEGHIAQYLGDGLLVYFGYPQAHEDDARRAVRAGLDILSTFREQVPSPLGAETPFSPSPFQGEGSTSSASAGEGSGVTPSHNSPHPNPLPQGARGLQIRLGIHTGLVVIGEMGTSGRTEQLALGETPNVAARIQGLADPNTLLISAATQRLISNQFECQPFGSHLVKGIETPIAVYHVQGEQQYMMQRTGHTTPLVGRDQEVGLLQERWEQVKEGRGQVVLLTGEPGIGKSRLTQTLTEQVEAEGSLALEARCSPYHQNSAFYPLIDTMQRALLFDREDTAEEKVHKLDRTLALYGMQDTLPLFAALLSLPLSTIPSLNLTPQKQKERTIQAMAQWWLTQAERQATVAVWEDLHWADPSTLEFLTLLLEQVPTSRLLVLLTSRPEFSSPWPPRSHLVTLMLNRLSQKHMREMVKLVALQTARPSTSSGRTGLEPSREHLSARAEPVEARLPLSEDLVNAIMAKTDGVPLFVEELTKSVIESVGAIHESPLHLAIPATLQDSLMARLDRLNTAKELAQLGATLGREFSYDLLQALSPLTEDSLQQSLRQLVESELVYQRGQPPQAQYTFKHALIQDAAYQSLLKSRRQQLHQQIAQVLEERFPETKEAQPELLAHHYTEAGLIEQAVPYWQLAGERATQRSAYAEAVAHFTKGLEVLNALPDTPKRVQQELALQLALGASRVATEGFAAVEVEKTYTRALELCQQVGETPQLFPVLEGLSAFYVIRAELQTGRRLAEQLLSIAQSVQDPGLLLEAFHELGFNQLYSGELSSAWTLLKQGVALYNPQQHRSLAFLYVGHDPGVCCLANEAVSLWLLGYPDQSLKKVREAVALAREIAHPFSLALALGYLGWSYQFCRNKQEVVEQADTMVTLSTEQMFPYWLAWGKVLRGWALTEQGYYEQGVAQIQQGLANYRVTGANLFQSYYLALLAEAYGKEGQIEEGLTVLAEALAFVDKTGERWYEAELYRLKGELLLQQQLKVESQESKVPNTQHPTSSSHAEAEAEACFLKAIDIAQRQQAKSWELRATTSLARLWRSQGKHHAAREMLSAIYNWFTEGFDTKDLQEAQALIEKLGQ